MIKLIEKIGFTVLCAGLLVLTPSFVKAGSCGSYDSCNSCSSDCNDYCDDCCWGDFEFGADFLYWKPCVDDLDYAAEESAADKHIKYRCIDLDWEPGLRVYFGMPDFYCDWGLSASWTWIESDDNATLKNVNDVLGILLHPHTLANHANTGFAKACSHWDSTYNEWEVLFSTDLSCKECHHFMPFFGLAGLWLDQDFCCDYYDGNTKTYKADWDSDLWGVGFRAGTEYQYRFSDCLSFFTKAAGTILYSESNSKLKSECIASSGYNITVKDDDCCRMVPGWHLGTGFSYDTSYCDCDFSFRFGYEFLQWCNIPNHRNFGGADDVTGHAHSNSPDTRTFGFNGFFAGLGMSF